MKMIRSVASVAKGALWLVRAGGLRDQMKSLQRVQDHHRWWQAGDLRAFEQKVYSQNGEDGILKEILRRIGVQHGFFVEFGVETGTECNCARLARDEQWSGVFFEAAPELSHNCKLTIRCFLAFAVSKPPSLPANIEELLAAHRVPADFDVLSIDIDGNDYWVWKAIVRWQPRVVAIEFNAVFPPPVKWVMQENLQHRWNGTNYYRRQPDVAVAIGPAKGLCAGGHRLARHQRLFCPLRTGPA